MREMKDSGIEWIKQIPTGWTTTRGKNILQLMKRPPEADDEVITCFRNGEVTLRRNRREEGFTFSDKEIGYQGIKKGDLVIHGMDGFAGAIGISDSDGKGSPVLVVCTTKENARYLVYYLRTLAMQDVFLALATGIRERSCDLRWNKIADLLFPVPELNEQCRIADYLDRKCSQIDAIIARQQEVIEKLKAYKLSVITEAVTKGLNPDVPMKDSEVEWIGEIPEHWKMVRLKFLLSHIIDCPHETPIYSADGDYLVIRTADQDLGKLRTDEDMYRLDEGEYQNRIRRMPLEKDDIVYGREGERWGLACLVPESNKYCLGQRMLQFRCKRELFLPRFAMWALNSKFVYLQGAVDTIGSTSPHVNISTVRNCLIPVPNINEQQEIIEYVDKKMLQLDKEVEHREMLIRKLNEYKKSLICEVVTGKKEV